MLSEFAIYILCGTVNEMSANWQDAGQKISKYFLGVILASCMHADMAASILAMASYVIDFLRKYLNAS